MNGYPKNLKLKERAEIRKFIKIKNKKRGKENREKRNPTTKKSLWCFPWPIFMSAQQLKRLVIR